MTRNEGDAGLARIRFGFDEAHVYLCLTTAPGVIGSDGCGLEVEWAADGRQARLVLDDLRGRERRAVAMAEPAGFEAQVAVHQVIELAVPLAALPASVGAVTELSLALRRDGEVVERWPDRGAYEFPIPDEGDWLSSWLV